jgi:hypothetical protein
MARPKLAPDLIRAERELAWEGDAVLSLFARQYILRTRHGVDAQAFSALTSNQFLSQWGQPTRVEAEIGRHFHEHGLAATLTMLEAKLIPLFEKQQARLRR